MKKHSKKRRSTNVKAESDLLSVALDHHQAGRIAQAEDGYQRLLKARSDNADAWHLWGVLAAQQGQFDSAVSRMQQALTLKPHEPAFLGNLGNAFLKQGRFGRAIDCYREALQHQPEDTAIRKSLATACERQLDLGIEHQQGGRLAEAEACYRDVLRGQPKRADAWHLLGVIALDQSDYEAAEKRIKGALELAPDAANFHNSLGSLHLKQRRYTEAVRYLEEALRLQPDLINPYKNLGHIFFAQRRFAESEIAYRKALGLRPDEADTHHSLGALLKEAGRLSDAQEACGKALELRPDFPEALYTLGMVLDLKKRQGEALDCLEKAFALNAALPGLLGMVAQSRAKMCLWDQEMQMAQELLRGLRQGDECVTPLVLLNFCDDAVEHRHCAEIWTQTRYSERKRLGSDGFEHVHDKIRLAYVSPDFAEHPVAYLIADLIERHDRSRFEVFGISIGRAADDPWRRRLEKGFDHFLDMRGESDERVVERLRQLEIDIAVDLAGYTASSRPGIFASRTTPIQVSYLGFPGLWGQSSSTTYWPIVL